MALERLRLDGKVAIVTGGARGVGLGIANVLAEAGAAIVLTDFNEENLGRTVAELAAKGRRVTGVLADVTKTADNERTIASALEAFGRIDILINNAGGSAGSVPYSEATSEMFVRDLHLNVISAFELTNLAAPHLMKHEGGSVVNISSRAAEWPGVAVAYSVAKAGLEQLTRRMAWALAPKVRVNAIALAGIMTDAFQSNLDRGQGMRERFLSQIPLQRFGDVEGIGLAALFLCSKDCFATASVIRLDGGKTVAAGSGQVPTYQSLG